jgi:smad nuclear-interacting protein 1
VALPSQDESFQGGGAAVGPGGEKLPPKQKPNFKPTGLLAKEANTVQGTTTVLKYHEPPEARKPSSREQWRMYEFKKKDLVDTVYLHQRSAWLLGRDEKVTDLRLEHPSISKQHAVIQFRYITTTNEFGDRLSKVKPYLIDLDSANGTTLNGSKVEGSRFVELVDQDVLAFGDSEREYVLMLPNGQA